VPKDYQPTEDCQQCFSDAFKSQCRDYDKAYDSTHHTVQHSVLFISWTSQEADEAGYKKLKNDADDTYESALRACMRKHKAE
jgi:hypothetical protein